MTDFDTRLASASSASTPQSGSTTPIAAERRWRVRGFRSATVGGSTATPHLIVLLAAASCWPVRRDREGSLSRSPDQLSKLRSRSFRGHCLTATAATEAIQGKLNTLGKGGLGDESRPGAAEHPAVAPSSSSRTSRRPRAGNQPQRCQAMEFVADELLRHALGGRIDPARLLGSDQRRCRSLRGSRRPVGQSGRAAGQDDDYRRHVREGCFVFVGMPTRTADGAPSLSSGVLGRDLGSRRPRIRFSPPSRTRKCASGCGRRVRSRLRSVPTLPPASLRGCMASTQSAQNSVSDLMAASAMQSRAVLDGHSRA